MFAAGANLEICAQCSAPVKVPTLALRWATAFGVYKRPAPPCHPRMHVDCMQLMECTSDDALHNLTMHPSSSKRSATVVSSRCASSRGLAARNSSIRRSSTRLTGVVSTLAILLFTFMLIPSTSAKCCINVDSRSDANAPQSFSVKVSGRATTFFPNNKKYDIQAVFPTNYALQPPKPVLPLTKPNCTQYVAPPNNNPNGFRCSYETTNPEFATTFFIEWKVIVPPPINPDTPQPKPEFLEFWVNGDMKCDQETSVDNCPDPATGKPTNATSSAAGRPAALLGSSEGGSMGKWIGFVSLALAVAGGLIV